jgi:hypothetical protein
MEKDILLGELPGDTGSGTSDAGYDNSGVNPDLDIQEQKEDDKSSNNNLLMYGGAALLLYYFFFKKK